MSELTYVELPDTIRVAWSNEDEQWVATCESLPSLSWLADTQSEAAFGFLKLLANEQIDKWSETLDWLADR